MEVTKDPVFAAIGYYGRWQLLMTFLISLFSFPCSFHIYSSTFTAASTDYWCAPPDHLKSLNQSLWVEASQPDGPCYIKDIDWDTITTIDILNGDVPDANTTKQCTEWEYDKTDLGDTVISEWNLVCGKQGWTSFSDAIYLTGVAVGGAVGGFISDKLGRKSVLMSMLLGQSIIGIFLSFSTSIQLYVFLRLLLGLCSVSVVFSGFVLAVELVGDKWVTIVGVCNFFPLPLSYIIVSLLSMVFPDWRQLQLVLSIPGCLLISLWLVLPESPRWLISEGRSKEALVILQKAAKFNKTNIPPSVEKSLLQNKVENTLNESNRISLLFKGPMLKWTALLFLLWFQLTIVYYGILLNIGNLGLGDLHLSSIILAIVEIPAVALSIPILLKAGRKLPICSTMVICGLACICSEIIQAFYSNRIILIVCFMISRFMISSTNLMIPTYTAEIYPTIIRNLGVGASQISAGFALICIPYLWNLTVIAEYFPMVTLGILSIIGGISVLFLPETGTKSMEEIMDEKLDGASKTNTISTIAVTSEDRRM